MFGPSKDCAGFSQVLLVGDLGKVSQHRVFAKLWPLWCGRFCVCFVTGRLVGLKLCVAGGTGTLLGEQGGVQCFVFWGAQPPE